MRLENFLALTRATLVNEPCVNDFNDITFQASKIKRGDLFFALDADEIELAILNGAYGIVFDTPTQIVDKEIAWISVENASDALKRLLRFKMIEKEVVAYECNEIVLKLSLQVSTQENFITLSGDIKSIFKTLWNIQEKTIVLFCPTLENKNIFATSKQLPKITTEHIQIMEQTLFETSFIYDDIFYERQLISPFFIPYLEELLHLYKTLKVEYKLKKFTPIEHFEAVFINKKYEIKSFGDSDKVLIFEPNVSLIDSQILFLQTKASWANTIFIIPSTIEHENNKNIFNYKNEADIIDILENNNFNFALIIGVDKSILDIATADKKQLIMNF
jgi:ferrochelatase